MEIVIRAAVVFSFIWLVTRGMGRRELAQLNAFELIVLVTIGDLVQQAITSEDYSVTGAVLAVGTIVLLTVALSTLSWRFNRFADVAGGRPILVMRDGKVLTDVLKQERYNYDDLLEEARSKGIADLAEVEAAILEADGKMSFLTRRASRDG